jgi:hypothetical protein
MHQYNDRTEQLKPQSAQTALIETSIPSAMFFRLSAVPVILFLISRASVMAVSDSTGCSCKEGGTARCCEEVRKVMHREIILTSF